MTVKGLWTYFLKGIKSNEDNPLQLMSQDTGQVWGVDASVWLHAFCSIPSVVILLNFDANNVPVTHLQNCVQEWFGNKISVLRKHNITPRFIFEVRRHPMKCVARASRDKKKEDALKIINEFNEKCNRNKDVVDVNEQFRVSESDRAEYQKALTAFSRPNEQVINLVVSWMRKNGIEYECAPYEAEWQLVKLEKDGIINAIVSIDGDCVVLGAKRVIFSLDYKREMYREYNLNTALGKYELSKYPVSSWPFIACVLGTDYVENIKNLGPVTAIKIFEEMKESNEWSFFKLRVLVATKKYRGVTVPDESHWQQMKSSANLMRYAPVRNDSDSITPLNTMSSETDTWSELIGFDPELPASINVLLAKKMQFQSFIDNGRSLDNFDEQLYSLHDNKIALGLPLPPFAKTNKYFCSMPDIVLRSYVAARMGYADEDREKLTEYAIEFRRQCRGILEPSKVPLQESNWVISEVLQVKDGAADWDFMHIYDVINDNGKVRIIEDSDIEKHYVHGNEHNPERAMLLLQGGNVLYKSIKWQQMETIADKKEIYVIRAMVVPSMKTSVLNANVSTPGEMKKSYTVFIAFGKGSDKTVLLNYPYSCCGCYDGRKICSHILAVIFAIMVMQHYPKDEAEMILNMPGPTDAQNLPTSVDLLLNDDSI